MCKKNVWSIYQRDRIISDLGRLRENKSNSTTDNSSKKERKKERRKKSIALNGGKMLPASEWARNAA